MEKIEKRIKKIKNQKVKHGNKKSARKKHKEKIKGFVNLAQHFE